MDSTNTNKELTLSTQPAPTIDKINVLEKSNSIVLEKDDPVGFVVVGRVDDVVMAINVVKGGFDWTEPDDQVEYHHCVRGTVHFQFKYGDQELPPIDVNAGELLTIPAGVVIKGTCSDDTVVLVIEHIKPWHV
jgi:quercetin dioxygenase-like cupin family protein